MLSGKIAHRSWAVDRVDKVSSIAESCTPGRPFVERGIEGIGALGAGPGAKEYALWGTTIPG